MNTDIFIKYDTPQRTEKFKKQLIQLRGHQCECCKNFQWLDLPINLELHHKDGDKSNNSLDNLEWCQGSYNVRHSLETGLKVPARGTQVSSNKLSEEQVLEICQLLIENNLSLSEIGEKYGVSKHCIFDKKKKKSWAWLTKDYNFN